MLDAANNLAVRKALATIGKLPVVKSNPVVLRVENLD
jgi:hypothetical protein